MLPRKPVKVTIDADLLAKAKTLSVNISRAAEAGISEALRREKKRLWKEENREAIESSSRWVNENGLPLSEYRGFRQF